MVSSPECDVVPRSRHASKRRFLSSLLRTALECDDEDGGGGGKPDNDDNGGPPSIPLMVNDEVLLLCL